MGQGNLDQCSHAAACALAALRRFVLEGTARRRRKAEQGTEPERAGILIIF